MTTQPEPTDPWTWADLNDTEHTALYTEMLEKAIVARKNAHAPYSQFLVGATLLTEKKTVVPGCNVENASYPNGECAEAVAVGNLITQGYKQIHAALVVVSSDLLSGPCGACRQRLREFAQLDIPIFICNETELMRTFTLRELLPYSFGPEHL